MAVSITVEGYPAKALRAPLGRVLGMLKVARGAWHIRVVKDAEMKALHGRMLGDPATTDVLTFDLRERVPRRGVEGDGVELDTVICVDEARRRARELGHRVGDELLLYAVHSLLHVQGYDDVTAAGARRMHRREDALLVAIGVGALYAGKK